MGKLEREYIALVDRSKEATDSGRECSSESSYACDAPPFTESSVLTYPKSSRSVWIAGRTTRWM